MVLALELYVIVHLVVHDSNSGTVPSVVYEWGSDTELGSVWPAGTPAQCKHIILEQNPLVVHT